MRSFRKSAFFAAMTVLLAWLTVELFAYAAYYVVTGSLFSYTDLHSQIARRARGVSENPAINTLDKTTEEVIHPYLGYVYNPEANSRVRTRYHVGIPISPHGFLDDTSPFQEKSDERFIVGIFGGSVAWRLSAEGTDSLVRELKKSPALAEREITIVRLALGGYKQPQQLMVLTYLLSQGAQFDAVVNLDGFNEVALPPLNLARDVTPSFPRNWRGLVERTPNRQSKLATGKLSFSTSRQRDWADFFDDSILGYSVAAITIWKSVDRWFDGVIARSVEDLLIADRGTGGYRVSGPAHPELGEAELYRELAEIWKRGSLQMARLSEANDVEYFHFLQPNQYVEGSKVLTAREKLLAWRPDHPYKGGVERGYPYLREAGEALRESGVRYVDLTMLFENVAEPIYADTCCHLNPRGNDILAAAVADVITSSLAQPALAPTARPAPGP